MIRITISILDENTRNVIALCPKFKSFIWTERYQAIGDFQLVLDLNTKNVEMFKIDRYITISTTKTLMVIEQITIDAENGELEVKGSSFETVLYRRIWHTWNAEIGKNPTHTLDNCFLTVFEKVFEESIGNDKGIVEYVKYAQNEIDEVFQEKYHYPQRGDNIGEYLYALAIYFVFGIKHIFNQETKEIIFSIYVGQEKQNIVFSKTRYNLKNSRYVENSKNLKTTALIAGEGEDNNRKTVSIAKSITVKPIDGDEITTVEYLGIKQREVFIDARDVQKESKETNASYLKRLKDRGTEKLMSYKEEQIVDGKILDTGTYKLNQDYSLGDIVNVKDDFFSAKVRITEIIHSWDQNGYEIYPSFEMISAINSTEVIATNIE